MATVPKRLLRTGKLFYFMLLSRQKQTFNPNIVGQPPWKDWKLFRLELCFKFFLYSESLFACCTMNCTIAITVLHIVHARYQTDTAFLAYYCRCRHIYLPNHLQCATEKLPTGHASFILCSRLRAGHNRGSSPSDVPVTCIEKN